MCDTNKLLWSCKLIIRPDVKLDLVFSLLGTTFPIEVSAGWAGELNNP
jgi:hypothetical protein